MIDPTLTGCLGALKEYSYLFIY